MMKAAAVACSLLLASNAVASDLTTIEGVKDPFEILWTDEEMGLYNTTDLKTTASCGSVMASYNGISAKSNGGSMGTGSCCGGSVTTGCAYQCVELAQRYMHEKHGIIPNWHDNANMMCSNYPSGISKTSNPQPGDLWVRTSGTWGHVAVITAVHSDTVDVLEQNASPSGKNTYSKSSAGCFLTAGHSNNGVCNHLGYYCGNDGLGKSANTLYYCSGAGADPKVSESCSFTCQTMPSGQDDKCDKSGGTCKNVKTGNYCGSDKISGYENTLYRCENSSPAGAKKCANGCHVAASGQNDYCN